MICAWCYGDISESDRAITDRHESRIHIECAMTEVGMGVARNDREYQVWLGMTDDEIED